jgi:16S rRNA processing protein RimM
MKLNVGRIGKAHGILGEATIEVRTDEAEDRFAIGAVLETESHGLITVVSARVHNGILLLGFEGIEDRNAIEELRNELLYADVDIEAPGVDEDDYHVLQLVGCKTFLVDGDEFGEVIDVLNLPGQDVLVIKNAEGEVLIPFVRQLVPIVDIKAKRMTVIPLEINGEMSGGK